MATFAVSMPEPVWDGRRWGAVIITFFRVLFLCSCCFTVKISDICGEMNPLVFSALEEVNLVFILMMSSTVMVDIVFARFMFCTFYWR